MNDEPNSSEFEEIDDFYEVAERIAKPTTLTDICGEQMRQAKTTFNVGLGVGIVGAVISLTSIICLLFFNLPATSGGVSVACGLILNISGFFMIKVHRETNNRLDEIRRDEHVLTLVGQITDPTTRDEAISNLMKAKQKLRLTTKG